MSRVLPQIAIGLREIAEPAPVAVQRRAYLPKELAEMCGVHPATASRWIQAGVIQAETRLGCIVVPLAEAERFAREGVLRPR